MKRTLYYAIFVLILCLSACLADGRSEEEYLESYSQFVDLGGFAYSPVEGDQQSEYFTIRREATDACSSIRDASMTPSSNLNIVQNIHPSIRVYKVDPEKDCMPVYLFDLPKGVQSYVKTWEGAVYRFIDYDGVLIMEVETRVLKNIELLVIQ